MAKPTTLFTGNVDIPFGHSVFSCRKVLFFSSLFSTATATTTYGSHRRCRLFCIPLSNDIPYPMLMWMVWMHLLNINLKMDNCNSKWHTYIWTEQLHFSLIYLSQCQCSNSSQTLSTVHVCNQIQICLCHLHKTRITGMCSMFNVHPFTVFNAKMKMVFFLQKIVRVFGWHFPTTLSCSI